MTPKQMAAAECCNYSGDKCLGIGIENDLSMTQREYSKHQCCLPDTRCSYFEECVLPLAEIAKDEYKAKAYRAASYEYKMKFRDVGVSSVKKCPDCQLINLGPRERYCPDCARNRRRKSILRPHNG